MKTVLTIAGSDSCAGAGIQADIKAISANDCYALSVITSVTAQNTQGVIGIQEIDEDIVEKQLRAIFDDIKVDAVKIGMVSSSGIIKIIRKILEEYKVENIVLDTVMVATSGHSLLKDEAVEELKKLINIVDIVTPNIPEAEKLSGIKINCEEDIKRAAIRIKNYGTKSVLIKGGHSLNDANDILYIDEKFKVIAGKRIKANSLHGTGCTLSSTIASHIARGYDIENSVRLSKNYINKVIENSFILGSGSDILNHFA